MSRTVLRVPGVSCNHCVAAIEGSVSRIGGVERVAVDLEGKLVTVEGDFAEPEVVDAIVDAGYEVAGRA